MAPYLHQDMASYNYRVCATDVDMALNLALTLITWQGYNTICAV